MVIHPVISLDVSSPLEISISELDLIGYIPQSDQRILLEEVSQDLAAVERDYSDIVDEYMLSTLISRMMDSIFFSRILIYYFQLNTF